MKKLRTSLIITIITLAFLSGGLAAALNQDEATVHSFFSPSTLIAGQQVTVSVFFTSNSSDTLQLIRIGLHFDWMETDNFVGFNDLSSTPITIAAGETEGFPQITFVVPSNVTSGIHSYFVTIDGIQGASTEFTWNSPSLTVAVVGGSGQTAGPTPTTAPTNGGGGQGGQADLQLYGAVVAVVVIVVLLVIVLVLRRKRTKPEQAPSQRTAKQETPQPEQTPEEKPSSGQDFDI